MRPPAPAAPRPAHRKTKQDCPEISGNMARIVLVTWGDTPENPDIAQLCSNNVGDGGGSKPA